MNRVKNQHLLAGVILLSGLSTFLCLSLVVSERSNSTRLENLQAELKHAREQSVTAKKDLGESIHSVKDALSQLTNTLTAEIESIQRGQKTIRNDVSAVDRDVKTAKARLGPLDLKLKDLEARLSSLEKPLPKKQ